MGGSGANLKIMLARFLHMQESCQPDTLAGARVSDVKPLVKRFLQIKKNAPGLTLKGIYVS